MDNDFTVQDSACNALIMSEDSFDIVYPAEIDVNELVIDSSISCVNTISKRYSVLYTESSNILIGNLIERYYRAIPKCHGLMDTFNLEAMGVTRLRRQPNFGLYGSGVIIGIIDTGIDYTNPLFLNADDTSRVLTIWDQTVNIPGEISYMGYGREYTREDINAALQSGSPQDFIPFDQSVDHGTFLAAVAAGNEDPENNFSGTAPSADLAIVKLKPAKRSVRNYFLIDSDVACFQENDIALGMKYLYNLSRSTNKPIAICIGLGTSQGGHIGKNMLEQYINELSNLTGVCVVTAAGNEAAARGHYQSAANIGMSEYEDVELRVGEGEKGFTVELWTSLPQLYSVEIISPGGEHYKPQNARVDTNDFADFIFEGTVINLNNYVQEQETGDQLIFLRFFNPAPGIWVLRVTNEEEFNTSFHVWLPIRQFLLSDTYFLRSNPFVTITSPGNASLGITAAAYNHINQSIYIDSGRGYTRDGLVKPDFAAPGVNIYGPSEFEGFTRRTGTSISVAEIAGVAAMLLEWGILDGNRPFMDTTEIKTLLIRGASRTEITYPNEEWGYGAVDIYGVFESLRRTM